MLSVVLLCVATLNVAAPIKVHQKIIFFVDFFVERQTTNAFVEVDNGASRRSLNSLSSSLTAKTIKLARFCLERLSSLAS
jgi:hypothetical protein